MAWFPFFVELANKRGLIVGGGKVALRKVEKLLPYGPSLRVVATDFRPEFENFPGVELIRQPFSPEWLDGMYFAIAATDDLEQNHRVAALCQQRGILVNVVDDRDFCTFLFPALVQDGPLSVGISTSGASPSAAVWLKERVNDLLPQEFGALLYWLESIRPAVRAALPEEENLGAAFAQLFAACLERERPLESQEITAVLAQLGEKRVR